MESTRILSKGGRPHIKRLRVSELRYSGTRGDRSFKLLGETTRIGSAPEGNELVLEDDTVSRFHCEIMCDQRGYRLRDLSSTNGTSVNGLPVNDVYLIPGATIKAGRTTLTFSVLEQEVDKDLYRDDHFGPLVGKSAAMRRVFAVLDRVAPSEATVLIEGESGTGKELVAQALHQNSSRSGGPFVVFDCASAPATTLESELFGHERGAFTGAQSRRIGVVEQADGGTLFLDELGELPLELQPKLLRMLEQREIRRLGSSQTIKVNVRIVAATNRDLAKEVNCGSFREDLFYRIAVVRLMLPPLREHAEDIPLLVERIVKTLLSHDKSRAEAILEGLSSSTLSQLMSRPWRGNVRELRNVIERTLALSGAEIPETYEVTKTHGDDQHKTDAECTEQKSVYLIDLNIPLLEHRKQLVALFEKTYISRMLEQNNNTIAAAARQARVDRAYFKRLMRKCGLRD